MTYKVASSPELASDNFDFVLVWNGHFSLPHIPEFEGAETFEGTQYHVHEHREFKPEVFDGKSVLIVGAWLSTLDMIDNIFMRQDVKDKIKPKKVFVASKDTKMIQGVAEKEFVKDGTLEIKVSNVKKINPTSVEFEDGTTEEIDTIMYWTGYQYWLPFFDPADKIIDFDTGKDRGYYFGPLYRKMISVNEPNIIFIGFIEKLLNIIPTLERQAQLASQHVEGKLELPNKIGMMDSIDKEIEDIKKTGKGLPQFYKFDPAGYSTFHYNTHMCEMTNLPIDTKNFQPVIELSYGALFELFKNGNLFDFKQVDYDKLLSGLEFNPTSEYF